MNSDWDSSEEEIKEYVSSLHIPINAEAKKEYDKWVEKECDDLWWYKKREQELKQVLEKLPYGKFTTR